LRLDPTLVQRLSANSHTTIAQEREREREREKAKEREKERER